MFLGGLHFLSVAVIDWDGNEELQERRVNEGFEITAVFGIVHKPSLGNELPKKTQSVSRMVS